MKKLILYFISLVLVMLVTGVFWGTWFTLTKSIDAFPPDNFIRIGKTIISNVAVPMSILMPATLLILLWICVMSRKTRPSFFFFVCSFLLMVLTTVITVGVEVPIDNQINTWTAETVPVDWTMIRARWAEYHMIRTFTSIFGFASLTAGILLDRAK